MVTPLQANQTILFSHDLYYYVDIGCTTSFLHVKWQHIAHEHLLVFLHLQVSSRRGQKTY